MLMKLSPAWPGDVKTVDAMSIDQIVLLCNEIWQIRSFENLILDNFKWTRTNA